MLFGKYTSKRLASTSGGSTWSGISGKPAWISPSTLVAFEAAHGHTWGQITGAPSFMVNLIDDTTPQLGGHLSMGANKLVSGPAHTSGLSIDDSAGSVTIDGGLTVTANSITKNGLQVATEIWVQGELGDYVNWGDDGQIDGTWNVADQGLFIIGPIGGNQSSLQFNVPNNVALNLGTGVRFDVIGGDGIFDDGVQVLMPSAAASITNLWTWTGGGGKGIRLYDNTELKFGTGSDFQIWSEGTHLYIQPIVSGGHDLFIRNSAGANQFQFDISAGTLIFHDITAGLKWDGVGTETMTHFYPVEYNVSGRFGCAYVRGKNRGSGGFIFLDSQKETSFIANEDGTNVGVYRNAKGV